MRSNTALSAGGCGSIGGNLIGLLNVRYRNVAQGISGIVRMKAMDTMRKSSNLGISIRRGALGEICSPKNELRVAKGAPDFVKLESLCSR